MAEMKVEKAAEENAKQVFSDVIGTELVPEKAVKLLHVIPRLGDSVHGTEDDMAHPENVRVVFRVGEKSFEVGHAYPEVMAMCVNLDKVWNESVRMAKSEKGKLLNLRYGCWMNLIACLGHEFHHLWLYLYDREAYENEEFCEGLADDFAVELLQELARKYEIEPPSWEEMPYFAAKWQELNLSEEKDEEWLTYQRKVNEEGIPWLDETAINGTHRVKTFREYIRGTYDPEGKDDRYDNSVIPVDAVITHESGEVERVEAEPKAELPEPKEAVAETAASVAEGEDGQTYEADEIPFDNDDGGETYYADDDPSFIGEGIVDSAPAAQLATGAQATPQMASAPTTTVPTIPQAAPAAAPAGGLDQAVLPQEVIDANKHVADAANMVVGEQKPQMEVPFADVPQINLSAETIQGAVKEIYMRCYANMMNNCQRLMHSDVGYADPSKIKEAMRIDDIIEKWNAHGLVLGYKAPNELGRDTVEKCENGLIRGLVYRKKQLPAYELYFNFNGHRATRKIIAQNPAKNSIPAQEARAGHAIAWVLNGDTSIENEKWIAKIRDNEYIPMKR